MPLTIPEIEQVMKLMQTYVIDEIEIEGIKIIKKRHTPEKTETEIKQEQMKSLMKASGIPLIQPILNKKAL
jgi:hypothetical protein